VRDVLYVDDVVEAMMRAHDCIDRTAGLGFNIGGGPANTSSLLELIDLIGQRLRSRMTYRLESWRRADQRYYVSDIRKFRRLTGWVPRVPLGEGLERLAAWLAGQDARHLAAASEGVAS
jgi:CDP-paratose 2-epimerase